MEYKNKNFYVEQISINKLVKKLIDYEIYSKIK